MIGSFLLLKKNAIESFQESIDYLNEKYLYSDVIEFTNYTLRLFSDRKIRVPKDAPIVFGSLFYECFEDEKAAEALLQTRPGNWIKARGNYLIIVQNSSDIKIYVDPLRTYHLFIYQNGEVISNSFNALCKGAKWLSLDEQGFYEKLLRGYIIAPNTLFKEIELYYNQKLPDQIGVSLVDNRYVQMRSDYIKDRQIALNVQLRNLMEYFQDTKLVHEEEGIDLGLSSGYDSRLLLAILKKTGHKNVQLHTHAIQGVSIHTFERPIAEKLAELSGYPIKVIETQSFINLKGVSLENMIEENWETFEGRNSHNMGAFTETYTLNYRKKVMGEMGISMSGLGGEIFRNYYYLPKKFCMSSFLSNNLFYNCSRDLVGYESYKKTRNTVIDKISQYINSDPSGSLEWVRKYYSFIRMPMGDACNNNAYNKKFKFVTPYIEPVIIEDGLKVLPHLGRAGGFEGEMIYQLDKSFASVPTHYGKSANQPGWKSQLYAATKVCIPQQLWLARLDLQLKMKRHGVANNNFLVHLDQESPFFHNAWMFLINSFPHLNWKSIHFEFACMGNAGILAQTLYRFRKKLNVR